MRFKLSTVLPGFAFDCRITPCACKCQNHWLVEQWKRLDFANCILSGLGTVENHEGLAFRLERLLGDDVDDGTVLAEDGLQRLFQRGYFDGFFEVTDLDVLVSTMCVKDRRGRPRGLVRT